jgi:hypothetical protein
LTGRGYTTPAAFRRICRAFELGGAVAMRVIAVRSQKKQAELSGIIKEINDLRELPSASIDLNEDRRRFI